MFLFAQIATEFSDFQMHICFADLFKYVVKLHSAILWFGNLLVLNNGEDLFAISLMFLLAWRCFTPLHSKDFDQLTRVYWHGIVL